MAGDGQTRYTDRDRQTEIDRQTDRQTRLICHVYVLNVFKVIDLCHKDFENKTTYFHETGSAITTH